MPRLTVFNMISADGFFSDEHGDMSWAHRHDPEWNAFVADNARGGGALLFGRRTYDMMASWWPTPMAMQAMPEVAERMNNLPKVVFSRTLTTPSWNNTTLVSEDITGAVRAMKDGAGKDMALMGSGTIVSQLAQAGLVDELQLVVNPIVLGRGRSMFATLEARLPLRLLRTRTFGNGNVMLCYGA